MPIVLMLHILKEFGRALIPALIIYTFIILPFWLAGIVREGVGIVTVVSVLPLIFPFISGYVMPPALLTGAVLCYGRISSGNEYSATQAGGIWPGWVLVPGFLIGIVATLGTLYLNDDVLAYSTRAITRSLAQGKVDMIEQLLNQRGVVRIGNYHLYRFPRDSQGRQALDMSVYAEDGATQPGAPSYPKLTMRAVAQDHAIRVMPEKDEFENERNVVWFDLHNCRVEQFPGGGHGAPPTAEHLEKPLYIDQNARFSITNKRVACWGISQLIYAIKKRTQDIVDLEAKLTQNRGVIERAHETLLSSMTPEQKALEQEVLRKQTALDSFATTGAPEKDQALRRELEEDVRMLANRMVVSMTPMQQNVMKALEDAQGVVPETEAEISGARGSLVKYYREFNSRIALSFCCVFFGLVGPLLGLLVRHGDKTVLFVAGFGVTALYLILFILCRNLSDFGGWVLWMPNLLLAILIGVLWKKLY